MKIKQAILAGSLTLLSLYYTSLQCFAEDKTQDETDNLVSPYFWLDYANETKTVLDTLGLSEFSIEGWAIAAVAGLSFSAFSYWDDYYSSEHSTGLSDVVECSALAYCVNTSSDSSGVTSYGPFITRSFSARVPTDYYSEYTLAYCSYLSRYTRLMGSSSIGDLSVSWSLSGDYWTLFGNAIGVSTSVGFQGIYYSGGSVNRLYTNNMSDGLSIPEEVSPPTSIRTNSIRFFIPHGLSIPSVTSHAGDSPEFILSDIVDNVQKSVPSADLSEITEQIEGIIGASSGDYYDLPAPLFPYPGDQQLLPTMETVDESNATFSSALDGTLWWFQNFKSMFESDFFKQFLPFIILSLIFAVAYLILRW